MGAPRGRGRADGEGRTIGAQRAVGAGPGAEAPGPRGGSSGGVGWLVDLGNYLPVLIFVAVGAFLGAVFVVLGRLVAPHRPDAQKNSPYECGFEAFEDARMKFDVRYYLVAILFILFDLEIAFLFPWAVSLRSIGHFGIASMVVFLAILVVGFIYEWKKGALEWD